MRRRRKQKGRCEAPLSSCANAPFRYQRFRPGLRIGASFYGSRYIISDPWRYRLPQAGYGRAWVRHYDDLLLIDTRRGTVIRVINNFYW